VGTPTSHRSHSQSYQDTETGEGAGEIQQLGRRIIEILEGGEALAGSLPTTSHMQPGSSVESDHEELRRSVREAFAPGSHR
jgi:vacuolar protein 8